VAAVAGGCPGGTSRITALLCADPKGTSVSPAQIDGTCSEGYIPNWAGLCANFFPTFGTSPAAGGVCAVGLLGYLGLCVTPPASANGISPGFGGFNKGHLFEQQGEAL